MHLKLYFTPKNYNVARNADIYSLNLSFANSCMDHYQALIHQLNAVSGLGLYS